MKLLVLIRLISISLCTIDESQKNYKVLNGLSPFVSLHVLELFKFAHERKITI